MDKNIRPSTLLEQVLIPSKYNKQILPKEAFNIGNETTHWSTMQQLKFDVIDNLQLVTNFERVASLHLDKIVVKWFAYFEQVI